MRRDTSCGIIASEIALSPTHDISLGQCSKSTVYYWARKLNDYLEQNRAEWRVRPNVRDRTLEMADTASGV